jgi:hypothetical protein
MDESSAGTDDIGDGVLGAYFVKSHVFRRNAMNDSLCKGDPAENSQSQFFDLLIEFALADQGNDFSVVASVGMPVGMIAEVMVVLVAMTMVVDMVFMRKVMMVIFFVGVSMLVMGCPGTFVAIVSAYHKTPARDSVAIPTLETAGGKVYFE